MRPTSIMILLGYRFSISVWMDVSVGCDRSGGGMRMESAMRVKTNILLICLLCLVVFWFVPFEVTVDVLLLSRLDDRII